MSMIEKKCCGCGVVHPVEVLTFINGLWLCMGCFESYDEENYSENYEIEYAEWYKGLND